MLNKNNYLYNALQEGVLDWAIKVTDHFLDVIYTGQKKDYIHNVLKDNPVLVKAAYDLNATAKDFTDKDFEVMREFIKNHK